MIEELRGLLRQICDTAEETAKEMAEATGGQIEDWKLDRAMFLMVEAIKKSDRIAEIIHLRLSAEIQRDEENDEVIESRFNLLDKSGHITAAIALCKMGLIYNLPEGQKLDRELF